MCHKTNNGKLLLQYLHSSIKINAASRNMNDLSVLRSGARTLQTPVMDVKMISQTQIHTVRIIILKHDQLINEGKVSAAVADEQLIIVQKLS